MWSFGNKAIQSLSDWEMIYPPQSYYKWLDALAQLFPWLLPTHTQKLATLTTVIRQTHGKESSSSVSECAIEMLIILRFDKLHFSSSTPTDYRLISLLSWATDMPSSFHFSFNLSLSLYLGWFGLSLVHIASQTCEGEENWLWDRYCRCFISSLLLSFRCVCLHLPVSFSIFPSLLLCVLSPSPLSFIVSVSPYFSLSPSPPL